MKYRLKYKPNSDLWIILIEYKRKFLGFKWTSWKPIKYEYWGICRCFGNRESADFYAKCRGLIPDE
jgi:hypothetical protein